MKNPWLDIPLSDYEGHIASPAVTPSPYLSLEALEAVMQFVAPTDLRPIAKGNGLRPRSSATRQTQPGKQFHGQVFQAR